MKKFHVTVEWRRWLLGILLPHGGMVVWTLCLGPVAIEFWPLAPSDTPMF